MEQKLDSILTLHPFEDITHYNIHLTINTSANLNCNSSRDLIIVVDRSGSMHSYLSVIKAALINLIDSVSSPKIFSTISFISFESVPKVFLKKNPEELKNIVKNTNASGGTNFSKTLKAIAESIPQIGEKIEFLQLIFLTDGEIQEADDRNNNYKNFNEGISNLYSSIKNHTLCFEIHTLGMGKNHDPLILDSLIKLGEGKGTYQFLASNDSIDISFDNILKELLNTNKILDVSLCSHSLLYTPINLMLKTVDQCNYEATGFIFAPFLKLQDDDLYLEMRIPNGKEKIHPRVEKSKEVEKFSTFLWTFERIKKQLEGISSQLMSLSKLKVKSIEKYEIIANELSDIKLKLHSIFRKVFRFSLEQRQILLNNATQLHQEYIPNIEKLLNAGFANQVNNELLANVQALSHRDKFSYKMKRLVERRAQTVAKLINEEAELVEKYVDKIDKSVLMQKYQSLLANTGCCIFTTNNFIEALLEHDCLCITFSVTCDESCMVNSNSLRVHKIFSSMITANSFLESVKFKLKIKPKAIGGFMHDENEKGGVIKGEAAEEINACLPIFLCPEHWEISQILMKPILGWVMTLDPLGFSFDQIKTVPFLVLIKCMEDIELNPEKEFQKRVFQNVFETCKNIMHLKMENKILKEEVREKFLTYFNEDNRVNEISNNSVFLLHLLCCIDIGFISKEDLVFFNDFFNKICEEEMRRNQKKLEEWELNMFLQEILNISYDLIQNFGDQKMKELKEQKEILLIENKKNDLSEESKQVDATGKFIDKSSQMTPKINEILNGGNLSESQKEYLETQHLSFKKTTQTLFKIKSLIDNKHVPIEFKNIGIEKPSQILCFSLQNLVQAKNSNRASALKNSLYKNAEKIEEAIDFLEGLAFKVVCDESNKLIKWKKFEYHEIKKNISPPIIFSQYEVFISFSTIDHKHFEKISVTYDIYEAALILEEMKIPRRHIMDGLFLHLKECVKLIEKIELIMLGTHNGKVFKTDWLRGFRIKPMIISTFIKENKIVYDDLLEVIEKKKAQRKKINKNKYI